MRCLGASASIHEGGREVSRFKGEEGLVVGRHSTFRVAAGALFYEVEGQKHCVMRKAILGIQKSIPQFS